MADPTPDVTTDTTNNTPNNTTKLTTAMIGSLLYVCTNYKSKVFFPPWSSGGRFEKHYLCSNSDSVASGLNGTIAAVDEAQPSGDL